MQANCPKCSHRIVIDDAKAPDRPFNVRCPKCQNPVRFPGKGAATPEAPAAAPEAAAPPPLPKVAWQLDPVVSNQSAKPRSTGRSHRGRSLALGMTPILGAGMAFAAMPKCTADGDRIITSRCANRWTVSTAMSSRSRR